MTDIEARAQSDGTTLFESWCGSKKLDIYLESDGMSFDVIRSGTRRRWRAHSLGSLIVHWKWLLACGKPLECVTPNEAFWADVEQVAAGVEDWPEWKKSGLNVEQPGIVKSPPGEPISISIELAESLSYMLKLYSEASHFSSAPLLRDILQYKIKEAKERPA